MPSLRTSSRRRARSGSATSATRRSCPRMMRRGSRACWESRRSDPRKALSPRPQEAAQDARSRQGLSRRGALELQAREGSGHEGRLLCLSRPPQPQARLPPPVDHAHQRRRPPERHELRRVHARPQARRHRAGPQGPGRHRRARRRDVLPICRRRPRGVVGRCLARQSRQTTILPGATSGAFFVSVITSHHNPQLKDIRRLLARREADGRFVAEGEARLAPAAAAGWKPLVRLRAGEDVTADALARVSALGSGSRELAVYEERWAPPTGPLCVALWGVRDPGNVGTVLRGALAFGVDCVAIGPDPADPYGPKAVRASMGALFAVPVARVAAIAELPRPLVALVAGAGGPLAPADAGTLL